MISVKLLQSPRKHIYNSLIEKQKKLLEESALLVVNDIVRSASVLKLLDLLPCGISIATDASCKNITHNEAAAQFLRIKAWDCFSCSADNPPDIKILREGKVISAVDMPIQRAAWSRENTIGDELECIWPDGVRKIGLWSAKPLYKDGIVSGVIATFEDITEYKKVEEERDQYLRDSQEHEARLQAIIDSLPVGLLIADGTGKISFINDIACEIWGGHHAQNVSRYLDYKAWWANSGNPVTAADMPMARALRGETSIDLDFDFERFDGIRGTQLFSSAPIRMPDGNITGCVGIVEDITERRLLEKQLVKYKDNLELLVEERTEQLRISEFNFRRLVENLPVVISQYDKELRYLFRSSGGGRHFAETEDVVGKTWEEIGMPEEVCGFWRKKFNEALQTGQLVEFETRFANLFGENKDWLVRVIPETCDAGRSESLLAVALDITERKALESDLIRLDRLNTVGEMAATIAHEVRNPLTTVRGYLQMFLRKAESANYRGQFEIAIEELDRANTIISDFLSLAKNNPIEMECYNLKEIVDVLLPLLQAAALRAGHEIETDIEDVAGFEMNQKEIRQMILNLARNGIEAMKERGKLTVRVYMENGRQVLTVGDTGSGIPANVLENLGKPFLTTKENGTGLGLSMCYRIAERHRAKITAQTSPQGTTFIVKFGMLTNSGSQTVQSRLFD